MRSRPTCRRRGFTLIEMLLVIGILVILITLAALFLPNLDRNKGVPNAVTQVEGWIRLQKNQALRDGAPRGIRLIPDPNNPNQCRQLQYIEQPDPIAPRGSMTSGTQILQIGLVVKTPSNPAGTPSYPLLSPSTATLVYIDVTPMSPTYGQPVAENNWDDPQNPQLNPGDFLELTGSPSALATVVQIGGTAQPRSTLVLDRPIDGTEVTAATPNGLVLRDGFRVVRSPRPLAGEPALDLHKDVFIDLSNCYPCPPPATPDPNNAYTYSRPWSPQPFVAPAFPPIDILFNSNGLVANASTGQVIVAVRHVDRPNDMIFVVVYTRTGKVTAVPPIGVPGIDLQPNQDPYAFARDGRNPGI